MQHVLDKAQSDSDGLDHEVLTVVKPDGNVWRVNGDVGYVSAVRCRKHLRLPAQQRRPMPNEI